LLNTDQKIILDRQNNFIETLEMSNAAKNFDILATDLYPAKILDKISAKPLFSCEDI